MNPLTMLRNLFEFGLELTDWALGKLAGPDPEVVETVAAVGPWAFVEDL